MTKTKFSPDFFIIQKLDEVGGYWNGESYTDDSSEAKRYEASWEAYIAVADIPHADTGNTRVLGYYRIKS